MSHEDAGHYAAKHSPQTKIDSRIAEEVRKKTKNGKITCAAAHKIADELRVSPSEVGLTSDLLEVRITQCQLGLHGYLPEKKIVKPGEKVSNELEKAIKASLMNDRITCLSCWDIGKRFGIARMDVAAACEALKIKISSCQLGAF